MSATKPTKPLNISTLLSDSASSDVEYEEVISPPDSVSKNFFSPRITDKLSLISEKVEYSPVSERPPISYDYAQISLSNQAPSEKNKYSAKSSLMKLTKCKVTTKIGSNKQGSIYNGVSKNGSPVIIKRACIKTTTKLIKNKQNNIAKEAKTLAYLSNQQPPKNLVKLEAFVKDEKNYFLVTKKSGMTLREHILMMHQLIKINKMSIKTWKNHVQKLFRQIVGFFLWLHKVAKVAHLDITLDNFLVKGSIYVSTKHQFVKHGKIIVTGFTNAVLLNDDHYSENINITSNKAFQSPKMYENRKFDPFDADIWSLGVVFYAMSFGKLPFNRPSLSSDNENFFLCMTGNIQELMIKNNIKAYTSKKMNGLIKGMLCSANKRWTIADIARHGYIKQC